jgi:hypothetical protein
VCQYGLRDWIIKYSDGKADPAMVERWINIPYSRGMIHFFIADWPSGAGVPTFMYQDDEAQRSVFAASRLLRQRLISAL